METEQHSSHSSTPQVAHSSRPEGYFEVLSETVMEPASTTVAVQLQQNTHSSSPKGYFDPVMEPTVPSYSNSPTLEGCSPMFQGTVTDSDSTTTLTTQKHTNNHSGTLEETAFSCSAGLMSETDQALMDPVTSTLRTEKNGNHSSLTPQESNSSSLEGVLYESHEDLMNAATTKLTTEQHIDHSNTPQEAHCSRVERLPEFHDAVMEPAAASLEPVQHATLSGTTQEGHLSDLEGLLSESYETAEHNKKRQEADSLASEKIPCQGNGVPVDTKHSAITDEAHSSRLKKMSVFYEVAMDPTAERHSELENSSMLEGASLIDPDISFVTAVSHPPDSVSFQAASEAVSQYYESSTGPDSLLEVGSCWTGSVPFREPYAVGFSRSEAESVYYEASIDPASPVETDARTRQVTSSRTDGFSDPHVYQDPASPTCLMTIDANGSEISQESAHSSSKFHGFQNDNVLSQASHLNSVVMSAVGKTSVVRNSQYEQTNYSEDGEAESTAITNREDVCLQDKGMPSSAEVCEPSSRNTSFLHIFDPHTVNTTSTSDGFTEFDSNEKTGYVKKRFTFATNIEEEEEDAELREYWTRALQTSTSTGEIVAEIVKVLKHHQKTHDLMCPVCGSCVTRRVILRKRKRSNFITVDRRYQDPVDGEADFEDDNHFPDVEEENQVLRDTEAFGCLSCFSLFFRKGHGLMNQFKEDFENCTFECLPFFFPPYPWGIIRPKLANLGSPLVTTPGTDNKEDVEKIEEIRSAENEQISGSSSCAADALPDYPWGSCKEVHEETQSTENEQIRRSFSCLPDVLPDYPWGSCKESTRIGTLGSDNKEEICSAVTMGSELEVHEQICSAENEQISGSSSCVPDVLPDYPWGSCKESIQVNQGPTRESSQFPKPNKAQDTSNIGETRVNIQSSKDENVCGCGLAPALFPNYNWDSPKDIEETESEFTKDKDTTDQVDSNIEPLSDENVDFKELPVHESSKDERSCTCDLAPALLPSYSWGSPVKIGESIPAPFPMHECESEAKRAKDTAEKGSSSIDLLSVEKEESAEPEPSNDTSACGLASAFLPKYNWGSSQNTEESTEGTCSSLEHTTHTDGSNADFSVDKDQNTLVSSPKGSQKSAEKKSCTCGLVPAILANYSWPRTDVTKSDPEEKCKEISPVDVVDDGSTANENGRVNVNVEAQETSPSSFDAKESIPSSSGEIDDTLQSGQQRVIQDSLTEEKFCTCGIASALFPIYRWGSNEYNEAAETEQQSAKADTQLCNEERDASGTEVSEQGFEFAVESVSDKSTEMITDTSEEKIVDCSLGPALLPTYPWGSDKAVKDAHVGLLDDNNEPQGADLISAYVSNSSKREELFVEGKAVPGNPYVVASTGDLLDTLMPLSEQRIYTSDLISTLLPIYPWGSVPKIEDEEENIVQRGSNGGSYLDLQGSSDKDNFSKQPSDHTLNTGKNEVAGDKTEVDTSLNYEEIPSQADSFDQVEEGKFKCKPDGEHVAINIDRQDGIRADMFVTFNDKKTEVQIPASEHSVEIEESVPYQCSTETPTRPSDGESITAPLLGRVKELKPVSINPAAGTWEILKPIVYGGLDISIASLGVTSSAAGGNATTRTVVFMGLSTLFSGLVLFYHDVMHLYQDHYDHYQAVVGLKLLLHGTMALISFLVFGVLSPLTYALSYRETDDRDHKFILCCVVALVSVIFLSLGKAKVSSKQYIKTLCKYVFVGVLSSVVGYLSGEHISELLQSWGL